MQTNETHTARFGLLAILTSLAVFAVFALLAQGLFGRIPVKLEGQRSSVQVGDSVEEALAERPMLARSGDLLAATDGRIVKPGGGHPPHVTINGNPASLDARVAPGDTIEVEPGTDAVEPTTEETRVISVPAKIVGAGAVLTVVAPGATGVQRVVVGTVSGDIVASETVVPAEPMVLRRVSGGGKKVVALTFDDGPWRGQTEKILDILKEEHVPATFFMLGMYAKKQPGVVARVADEGHDIGNHTYHHVDVTKIDKKKLTSEIEGTNAVIVRAGGDAPTWFRPPMGRVSQPAYSVLKEKQLRPVLWTVDPQDWRHGIRASQICNSVVDAVRPGSVILLHDGGGDRIETIKALPWIIHQLRAKGYEFVLLDDLPKAPKARW